MTQPFKVFLNIHVRESNGENCAIETLILKFQAFAGAMQISSVWKSHPGRFWDSIVEKFSDRETREMQPYRQTAARNEHAVNF